MSDVVNETAELPVKVREERERRAEEENSTKHPSVTVRVNF